MFIFHRHRSTPVEVYSLLLPEGDDRAAEKFGNAVRFNAREHWYHEVGTLVLITTGEEVEYILTCKNGLTDAQKEALYCEMEHLVGKDAHTGGMEPTEGWYVSNSLRNWTPEEKPKRGKKKT